MTKDEIQDKIRNLNVAGEVLRNRRDEIRDQYSRPIQWMADEDYVAIARNLQLVQVEIAELVTALDEIEDQEWADRQAENYFDGQV